jgi:hypothetical protein
LVLPDTVTVPERVEGEGTEQMKYPYVIGNGY